MKSYDNPERSSWAGLVRRPQMELSFLDSSVRNILHRVKNAGDGAVRELTFQFDKVRIKDLRVSAAEIELAIGGVSNKLKEAIGVAAANIEAFHAAQRRTPVMVETMPGVRCWRKAMPVPSVGIYIPGGSAPLFSTVLMLGIPARLAGCPEIVLTTPPDKDGRIHPAILYAANLVGITKIFRAGGAQAIAAMAYGTESVPAVNKIFGPGNQYVTRAKQIVLEEGLAIDMPAGPSELLVLADDSANPLFIAADLISQAEHGADSQVVLLADNDRIINATQQEITKLIIRLPRKAIAEQALANSMSISFRSIDTAIDFVNMYAPEHLIINHRNARALADKIQNAGSVFLGNYSPEAVGDYASGTNHTLPTNGYARAYAGVSLESFLKYTTFQEISEEGIRNLGPTVETLAMAEALEGHKLAVSARLDELINL